MKELKDIRNVLATTISAINIIDTADIIGVETFELNYLLEKGHNLKNKKYDNQITKIIEKIYMISDNNEFNKKIINKIKLLYSYGNILKLTDDILEATIKIKSNTYNLNILIEDNKIMYIFTKMDNTKKYAGQYKKEYNKSYISYDETKTIIYNLSNQNKSYNIENKKIIQHFEDGYEYEYEEEETKENYYIDKKGNKTFHEPSPFENYILKRITKRLNRELIIFKEDKRYEVKDENKLSTQDRTSIMIGINIKPDDKLIPRGGNYVWVDEELYNEYLNGNYTDEQLFKYRGDNYKYIKRISKEHN